MEEQYKLTQAEKEEHKQLKKQLRELEHQLKKANNKYNRAIEKLDEAEVARTVAEELYWTLLAARDDLADKIVDWLDTHVLEDPKSTNTTED
jgi:uncharacterized protein involved in exopolysaccharide biosynthesis